MSFGFWQKLCGFLRRSCWIDRRLRPQYAHSVNAEELATLKHELMKAEVRLAKARASVVRTEIDIKVLDTRLKAVAP